VLVHQWASLVSGRHHAQLPDHSFQSRRTLRRAALLGSCPARRNSNVGCAKLEIFFKNGAGHVAFMTSCHRPQRSLASLPPGKNPMHDLDSTLDAPETAETSETVPGVVHKPLGGRLREFTDAAYRPGPHRPSACPTNELLAFQLAHARAKDAVHMPVGLYADCASSCQGFLASPQTRKPCPAAVAKAADRASYLQRPDLGRQPGCCLAGKAGSLNTRSPGPAVTWPSSSLMGCSALRRAV